MKISEEAIEAAAEGLVDHIEQKPWEHMGDHLQSTYRDDARAALEAAAPLLMAQAWDEGCDQAASSNLDAQECKKHNPYRQ